MKTLREEQTEATRDALVAAARVLFGDRGYVATSTEEIVRRARVTRGALYHHFAGKREVFRAVYDAEQQRLARIEGEAFRAKRDPWQGFKAGCRAYLEAASEPGVQRITLLDAPGALGGAAMRESESDAFAMAVAGLERAMAAGRIGRRPAEPLASLLFGALGEAAMAIARSDDQPGTLRAMTRELGRLLDGLANG